MRLPKNRLAMAFLFNVWFYGYGSAPSYLGRESPDASRISVQGRVFTSFLPPQLRQTQTLCTQLVGIATIGLRRWPLVEDRNQIQHQSPLPEMN